MHQRMWSALMRLSPVPSFEGSWSDFAALTQKDFSPATHKSVWLGRENVELGIWAQCLFRAPFLPAQPRLLGETPVVLATSPKDLQGSWNKVGDGNFFFFNSSRYCQLIGSHSGKQLLGWVGGPGSAGSHGVAGYSVGPLTRFGVSSLDLKKCGKFKLYLGL
jgi:hypothetical protein